jgi:D-apiose dehydrogenase
MNDLRFAVFGAGFWTPFQLAGWTEVPGAKCVAIYNRTATAAQKVANAFGIPGIYDDPEELLQREEIDFVDIITHPSTHGWLVQLAARHDVSVICQKPMAVTLPAAELMVRVCKEHRVPFYVHENWRWQAQIRELKKAIDSGEIGAPFRARVFLVSGFPVFKNEPSLKELEKFILLDMGTHVLDVARFLFGEADDLYCHTKQVQKDIKAEDVATIMIRMAAGTTVTCYLGFPGHFLERDAYTQTLILVEGDQGSVELDRDYWIRVTSKSGTRSNRYPPIWRNWMLPDYQASHASIAACNANLLAALRGEGEAETTAEDNLKTLRLVFAAYESASSGQVIRLSEPGRIEVGA